MRKISSLVMGLSVIALGACSSKEEKAEVADTTPIVKVAKVEVLDVDQQEIYTATVESDVVNNIAPQSYLRIKKINAEVGDRVAKGQVLVELDTNNLQQLQLQMENTKINFNRIEELYKIGGVSKSDYDNAKTQLDVMQTQYRNLLENSQLRSPISGVVTARNYDNGDMTGMQPVLVVEQDMPVKLIINISEDYYPLIKKGMKVDVTIDTYGDEVFAGTVNLVYPSIDTNTHTFPVEVRLANSDRRVRPGMFGRVKVVFGQATRVVVPDEAVIKQKGAGDYYVYVLNADNTVSYNKVQLGRRMGTKYEIKDGVENGASVVVAGQANLASGRKVSVQK